MSSRNRFWDVVKGVCIIAVILIHTTSVDSVEGIVWRQFINFPVALFFFMAGYFCHCKGKGYCDFLVGKSKRLLVPLLVVCIARVLLHVRVEIANGRPITGQGLFESFLSYPLDWGYFVLALFQCFLVAPMFARLPTKRALSLAGICYVCSAAYLYMAHACPWIGLTLSGEMPMILGTSWLLLFVIGLKLKDTSGIMMLIKNKSVVLLLMVMLGVAIVSGICWYYYDCLRLARAQLRIPNVILAIILSIGCLKYQGMPLNGDTMLLRWLARLGEGSFFIYLWHWFVIARFRFASGTSRILMPVAVLLVFSACLKIIPHDKKRRLWFLGL